MDLKSINKELKNYLAREWLNKNNENINYRLRAPNSIDKKKKYPLLVYFHGSGGRGDDNMSQLTDAGAIEAFFNQQISKNYCSYILAAQVPKNEKWVNVPWENLSHKMPKISNPCDYYLKFLMILLKIKATALIIIVFMH